MAKTWRIRCWTRLFSEVKTRKDNIFTVALIGRPNVGKSTLLNRLVGHEAAIVDKTPGLTRDRKEIITTLQDIPVRIVDTAGWDPSKEKLAQMMIWQTRQALIYSDLGLFLVDTKAGITKQDEVLARWLRSRMEIKKNKKELNQNIESTLTLEERAKMYQEIVLDAKNAKGKDSLKKKIRDRIEEAGIDLPAKNEIIIEDKQDVIPPPILLIANKAEGYLQNNLNCEKLQFGDPIYISAEHGDGIIDIYSKIIENYPEDYVEKWQHRMQLRRERQEKYKQSLTEEIKLEIQDTDKKESKESFDYKEWEEEFDKLNPDPEYNSDYDSDSEVNPISRMFVPGNPTKKLQKISAENSRKRKRIQLSFVGQPNVGKSSIINSLLQENRVIASDIPGTTRDAISIEWRYLNRKITLVDTAGLRPKIRVNETPEKKVYSDTQQVINYSHIVGLVIDSRFGITPHDIDIMQSIIKEGRGMVLILNKWDLIPAKMQARIKSKVKSFTEASGTDMKSLEVQYVSALSGFNVNNIMKSVLKVYEKWNTRISTSLLNRWLAEIKRVYKMPNTNLRHLKIKYVMQIGVRPPTFYFNVNDTHLCPSTFERFLSNALCQEFKMSGIPVRVLLRDSKIVSHSKPQSDAVKKIRERIKIYKKMLRNPTHRRRVMGSFKLFRDKTKVL